MKSQTLFALSLLAYTSCFAAQQAQAPSKSPADLILIEQITSIVEPGKIPGQNFSIEVKLKVTDHTLNQWAIGFYMPRTFNQLVRSQTGTSVNPDLQMEICDMETPDNCMDIQYVNTEKQYLSAGYTNIVAPVDPDVSLEFGKTYLLKLTNSNQWAPGNFSAMPQGFFLIENDDVIIPLSDAKPEAFLIGGYNEDNIKTRIANHIQSNWVNSKPITSKDLADHYHLVPAPMSITQSQSDEPNFLLSEMDAISISNEFQNDQTNFALLQSYLQQDLDITLVPQQENATIRVEMAPIDDPEGYELQITPQNIFIRASNPAGAFYALQTLRQLLYYDHTSLPTLTVQDQPRFKYRGVLLDVSRHFFTVNEIKKLLDVMAAQKLNSLHIHFADDEGWRLEIAQLNDLIGVGSVRGFTFGSKIQTSLCQQANLDITNYGDFSPSEQLIDPIYPKANTRYEGYYSEQDINTLIAYANERQITIIPEIDLPGHARALVYSMPEIFKDENDLSKYISIQGYTDNVILAYLYGEADVQALAFTQTMDLIIKRIGEMFANQTTVYHLQEVSIGGDEVSNDVWTSLQSDQSKEDSGTALEKLQKFFSQLHRQAGSLLFSGWQQFVQSENGHAGEFALSPNQTAHVWVWEPTGNGSGQQGIKNAASLINAGYPTVLTFADDTYFDLTYTPDKWEPGFSWAGAFLDTHAALRSAYDASQVGTLVNEDQKANLVGLEGTLWSENLMNFDHLAYMALPKMTGLAEAAWSGVDRTTDSEGRINWKSLSDRLGYDNRGFLGFLHSLSGMKYRGYPNGISQETPVQ